MVDIIFENNAERLAFEKENWVCVWMENPVKSIRKMRQLRAIQREKQRRHNNYHDPDLKLLLKAGLILDEVKKRERHDKRR